MRGKAWFRMSSGVIRKPSSNPAFVLRQEIDRTARNL
jgi:hypothetical protein